MKHDSGDSVEVLSLSPPPWGRGLKPPVQVAFMNPAGRPPRGGVD